MHNYAKPNDTRGIQLMNRCAHQVFAAIPDCVFAIGASDEYRYDAVVACAIAHTLY
jgi:tRNA(His) 5'-end guanylyltransferase